jgi:KaiC/GvpD/RAD55 family RecA-like ATPase
MKLKTLSTGISTFDRRGGLPVGLNLLIGDPEADAHHFVFQIIIEAIRNNLSIAYIAIDRSVEDVVGELSRLGCNPEQSERNGLISFVDLYSLKQNLQAILPLVVKNTKILVVDSLSNLILSHDRISETQDILAVLRSISRNNDLACLLLAVRDLHDKKTVALLKQSCDAAIEFFVKETGQGRMQRFLRVLKMAHRPADLQAIPFAISAEGIVIEEYTRT